ncbi:MAG: tellurite resistance TerB family protein [Candidatus Competibacteraceae bacterium]|nr:tellurite resistance TerB family protein [Candidatus Competibacteraceae bacterium]MBK7982828.1 tellurite resistance TerB family protein [Candidatus Competibacteraceae bacterium]MBK8898625.1 tellurite resistance TerB family protein [Candidatus Competibacteraceae bacterium]MBK8962426.1 tellurite resistance TerB family protein [Candidatus Competibacteraceae bacterium]MBK9951643.1 tellurite resistance TerB family protein [Candidatus Competibacteraceae bacterium]
MDVGSLFDQLLQSGRDLVAKGQNLAEQKLDIPSDRSQREATLASMGKGAAMAGVAALLLGTGVGRSLSGLALKLGSLGAIGGLAYKTYQDWQAKNAGNQAADLGAGVNALSGPQLEKRSLALLKAMIAAAKADGHIDEKEQSAIDSYLHKLDLNPEALHLLKTEIAKPLNAQDVAAGADSPAAAAEIYVTSLLAINLDNDQERAYMDELARALKLPPGLIAELQNSAKA